MTKKLPQLFLWENSAYELNLNSEEHHPKWEEDKLFIFHILAEVQIEFFRPSISIYNSHVTMVYCPKAYF